MAVSTGSRIFIFIAIIVGLFFIGFAIANIYYYKQIADGRTVSRSTGNVMLWLNVVLLILAFILTAWALYQIFVPPETKVAIANVATQGVQYLTAEPYTQRVVAAPMPVAQPSTQTIVTAQAPPTQYIVDQPQPTIRTVQQAAPPVITQVTPVVQAQPTTVIATPVAATQPITVLG